MRSIRERIIHTGLFEVGAVTAVSPVIAWATGTPLGQAGAVTLLMSVVATGCNYGWTLVVDRLAPTRRRGFLVRAGHALGLEALISLFAIPILYGLTQATLLQAVALDLAGTVFFVVYAMAYNWLFDRVMLRIEARGRVPAPRRPDPR